MFTIHCNNKFLLCELLPIYLIKKFLISWTHIFKELPAYKKREQLINLILEELPADKNQKGTVTLIFEELTVDKIQRDQLNPYL